MLLGGSKATVRKARQLAGRVENPPRLSAAATVAEVGYTIPIGSRGPTRGIQQTLQHSMRK